jgi:hypothetical protein
MHYNQNKPTYEKIRKLPALTLINMSWDKLKKIEKEIKQENERALLSLKWLQGIRRIKTSAEYKKTGKMPSKTVIMVVDLSKED